MRRILRRLSAAVLFLCIVCAPQLGLANGDYGAQPNTSPSSYDANHPENLVTSNLTAQAAILIDARTGEVLFTKNPDKKIYPASITKILTAMVVLERARLDEVVTVDLSKMGSLEASWLPLENGEQFTVEVLLHGMLIRSFNDFAAALAVHVGGSLSGFAQLMNQKAQELGCADSNFVTPHGLPNTGHYTTARDMSLIARAAMQNETFRGIVARSSYTVPASNKHADPTSITSGNRLLPDSGTDFAYPGCIGVKTGYTNSAQHSFVGAVQRDGQQLICVILGSRGTDQSPADGKWYDATRLFDYAFATREAIDVAALYAASPTQVEISGAIGGDSGLLNLAIADAAPLQGITAPKGEAASIRGDFSSRVNISYVTELTAPIESGQKVAVLTYESPGGQLVTCDLIATRAIQAALPSGMESSAGDMQRAAGMPPTLTEITSGIENSPMRYLAWLLLVPVLLLVGLVISMVVDIGRNRGRRGRSTRVRNYSR